MDPASCGGRFEYEVLPSDGWFRVMLLEPAKDSSQLIKFRLEHHPISKDLAYEALSYTWGDEDADSPVSIEGKPYLLRKNLHNALQVLRFADRARTLWVDAVCINQDDEQERNHQVWQMSDIYANANRVNVWLGDASEGSDRAMDFLESMYNELLSDWHGIFPRVGSTRERDKPLSLLRGLALDSETSQRRINTYLDSREEYDEYYRTTLTALRNPQAVSDLGMVLDLFARRWWKRMWTLQESVLCETVTCICGERALSIQHFDAAAYFVYYSINFDAWPGPSIPAAASVRSIWRTASLRDHIAIERSVSLILALDSSWNRRASDNKDKIMGLLGLVGRRKELLLEYSMATEKIYRAAFRAALVEEGDLDGLGFMSEIPEARNPNLPTWVPDFELHSDNESDHIASLSKPPYRAGRDDIPLYNASRPSNFPGHLIYTDENDSILVLRGLLIDEVGTVGHKAPGWSELADTHSQPGEWSPWGRKMYSALKNWRAMISPEGSYSTGEPTARAFWRTVLVDLKQGSIDHVSHRRRSRALGASRLGEEDMAWLRSLETEAGQRELIAIWEEACDPQFRQTRLIEQFNRRFFITKAGYFGLGPPSLRAGHEICVLLRGRVAYAVHRMEDNTWGYVGECYVHGIMNGEGLKGTNAMDKSHQTFRIR